jgi:hypothetical protein
MKMEKKLIKLIIFCLLDIIWLDMAIAADNIRRVKAIDFRGLEILSKYDLFVRARVKTESGNFSVNIDSLNRVLAEEPYIESFNVSESNERLIVEIKEKKPVMLLALSKGGRLIPFEADLYFKPISPGRIYSGSMPLVIIDEKDANGGTLSYRVKIISRMLEQLKKSDPIYNELDEIRINSDGSLNVNLKGRRTLFKINSGYMNFIKLKWTAGYIDRIRRNPETVDIRTDAVVIR